MEYFAPTDLDDALALLAKQSARVIAGGTDWYPSQGERPVRCNMLDVTRISCLRGITQSQGAWRIGAATTWSDLLSAELPAAFDGLKAAGREVGSVQIQNAGTLVGNICNASPAADGVPPLLCLNAEVEIRSLSSTRRVPLDRFLQGVRKTAIGAGEIVTAITIPETTQTRRSAFIKLGARKYLVISIAMVAVSFELDAGLIRAAHVSVGACSPVAQRLTQLEGALNGVLPERCGDVIMRADFSQLSPIDDVRGSGAYRLETLYALIERAILEAADG